MQILSINYPVKTIQIAPIPCLNARAYARVRACACARESISNGGASIQQQISGFWNSYINFFHNYYLQFLENETKYIGLEIYDKSYKFTLRRCGE